MGWIEFESIGLFRPGFADVFGRHNAMAKCPSEKCMKEHNSARAIAA